MRVKDNDTFIKALDEKFPNKDYEVIGHYISNNKELLVKGKYGNCLISPYNLLRGRCPSITSAINTYDYTIKRFRDVHGDTFEYEDFTYVSADQKISITCPLHGAFKQSILGHYSGSGCMRCSIEDKANVCRLTENQILSRLRHTHRGKFTYPNFSYKTLDEKVDIVCPVHGAFRNTLRNHLSGSGCAKCSRDKNGYGRNDFVNMAEGRPCTIYVIICQNHNETFCKVGITSKTVKERFPYKTRMPYSYCVEEENISDAETIWNLELKIKKQFSYSKYTPKIPFPGMSECFTTDVLYPIIDEINSEFYEDITERDYYE